MKETNEMTVPKHAEKVVSELDAEIQVRETEIGQLKAGRAAIVELYGIPTPAAEASLPDWSAVQTPVRRGRKGGRKAKTAVAAPAVLARVPAILGGTENEAQGAAASGRQLSAETLKLTVAARVAPEPFTVPSLCVATGLAPKVVSNFIARHKVKGWIVSAAFGEYKRTAQFPAEAPETE